MASIQNPERSDRANALRSRFRCGSKEERNTTAELVNNVDRPHVRNIERALLSRAAAGDRDARRALFEQYREGAYRTALRITRRDADALDVVQDSFIRAFERLGEFNFEAGFGTWLTRIVSNRALDLLRARKVRLAASLDGAKDDDRGLDVPGSVENAPSQRLEQAELGARLRRAVDRLPADQRAVFSLYATGEMTYGQIAELLGIPIGTVMSRLYHARRRLHEMLPDLAPVGGANTLPQEKSRE